MKKVILFGWLTTLLLFGGEFERAMEAYQRGSFIESLNSFSMLAQSGDARAQYNLGLMYAQGKGTQPNELQAKMWYTKAAEQGLPQAAYNLAILYHIEGERGAPHAFEQARYWYEKAATGGVMAAHNNLGTLYLQGKGGPKDIQKAFMHFQIAAQGMEPNGLLNAALLYAWGEGVQQDKMKAYEYLKKARNAGKAEATPFIDRLCKESAWVCQKQ